MDVENQPLRYRTDREVLEVIWAYGPISRAEVSTRTGISKPTVSESVRRLEEAGLLRRAGESGGRPGRIAQLYELRDDIGRVIAMESNASGVRVRIVDIGGRTVAGLGYPPFDIADPVGSADRLREIVAEAATAGSVDDDRAPGPVRCVAMSVASAVHPRTQQRVSLFGEEALRPLFQPIDVLEAEFGVPVLIENDVNLAAMAERAFGVAGDVESFAYVFADAGIGAGLVLGDVVVRGAHGAAGEIGFLHLGESGTSIQVQRERAERLVAQHVGVGPLRGGAAGSVPERARELADLAEQGDPGARTVLSSEGRRLGEMVLTICAIADPEVIVLAGAVGIAAAVVAEVEEVVAAVAPMPIPIRVSPLGEEGPLRGATEVALRRARADLWQGRYAAVT
jgi:predicted NBD/HSP70 family sugar kinase